jgi:hypothetical protein
MLYNSTTHPLPVEDSDHVVLIVLPALGIVPECVFCSPLLLVVRRIVFLLVCQPCPPVRTLNFIARRQSDYSLLVPCNGADVPAHLA